MKSAQLAYQAPLPTALTSVPRASGRRTVGSGSVGIVQSGVKHECTVHANLKPRCQRTTLRQVSDDRVALLEDLANPVRYGVLTRLERAPATASELAAALAVSPTQLANHLRRLRDHGLVTARRSGRHTAYELAEPGLRELFSALSELRPREPAVRPSRAAGTCYDHLCGRLGVALFDRLEEDGALVRDGTAVRLGGRAEAALAPFGVTVPAPGRRLMAYACLDSTEGRPHLGGALGAAVAGTLFERGWVEHDAGTRSARVTPRGRRALRRLLGAAAVA
jgi:DNA-binding transcriptional ArsR family regulator